MSIFHYLLHIQCERIFIKKNLYIIEGVCKLRFIKKDSQHPIIKCLDIYALTEHG